MREEELLKDEIDGFFGKEISNCLFPIKEKREGKSVYHYVLVHSDKREMVQEQFKAGSISVKEIKDYSQILYSGWGRDPLESISDRIKRALMSGENFKLTFDNNLYNTVRNGGLEEVRLLIKQGRKQEADENGWTFLHHAAYGGDSKVVSYLVNNCRFKLDVKDKVCNRKPVHIAAREGHIAIVEFFLPRININVIDGNNWTLLHYAAYGNHLEMARFLIGKKINVHARNARGMEPIHVAVKNGCKDVIEFFLDKDIIKNIGINDVDSKGHTPLYYAVREGHLETVKFLVKKGADIHSYGMKPIYVAAKNGRKDVIEFFLNDDIIKNIGEDIDINDADGDGWTLLHYAASRDHLETVEFLVNRGANIGAREENVIKPIHTAVWGDNLEIVKFFLSKGASVDDADENSWTLLHHAAEKGSLRVAEFLIDERAGIYAEDARGMEPIHVAAKNGCVSIIRLFFEEGINIDRIDREGNTPLHYATRKGCLEAVEYLLNERASIYAKDVNGMKPVHIAAEKGHTNIIGFFLKSVSVNDIDERGLTPLYYAVREGHLETVKFLVEDGAKINAEREGGVKFIHVAAEKGHREVIEFFLSKGMGINDTDNRGYTPLHYAVRKGGLETVKFLVKKGADIYAQNGYGMRPIDVASKENLKGIIEYFLEEAINVNSINKEVNTLLHYAVWKGNLEMVEFLVGKGYAQNINGVTLIHTAVERNHENIIEYFLEKGISVNVVDKEGNTLLHHAARSSHLETVKFLVKKGADIYAQNGCGMRPMCVAYNKNRLEVAKFLLSEKNNTHDSISRNSISDDNTIIWSNEHVKKCFPLLANSMILNSEKEHDTSSGKACYIDDSVVNRSAFERDLILSSTRNEAKVCSFSLDSSIMLDDDSVPKADVLEQQPEHLECEPQPKLFKVEKKETEEQCIAGKVDSNPRTHLQDSLSTSVTTPNTCSTGQPF